MKPDKDVLREEYGKCWNSEKMVTYDVNLAAAMAELPDGGIIVAPKQNIEKHFCFGESGYDYDDAQKMAAHARTSEDYFRKENMRHYDEILAGLDDGNLCVVIGWAYYSQPRNCKLRGWTFAKQWEIIEACGGSCNMTEIIRKPITLHGNTCYVASPEEVSIIRDLYREAREIHRKKVETYLKKYGLTKVHSWTYWRDA